MSFVSAGKGYTKVFSPRRISRSLVTVLALSFIQVVAGPVLAPTAYSPKAEAAFETAGLIVNWDASNAGSYSGQGSTTFSDLSGLNNHGTVTNVGGATTPTYTSTGSKYLTLTTASPNTATSKYSHIQTGDLRASLDQTSASTQKNISLFAWVYPTANGIILEENNGIYNWLDSQIEMYDGKFRFRVWNSNVLVANFATPFNNWYYVGLTYNHSTLTLTGYVNGQQVDQQTSLERQTPWEYSVSQDIRYSVGNYSVTNVGSGSAGNFRFGSLHIYKTPISAAQVENNFLATQTRFAPATTNPTSASITTNRSATFSATCSGATSNNGSTACAYQWERSINSGASWSDIAGATTSTYTTPRFDSVVSGYQYRVRAYDPGTGGPASKLLYVNSAAATLTVTAQPVSESDTALNLNGTSQYVVASGQTVMPTGPNDSFTFEAWVNATSVGVAAVIFSQGTGSSRFYIKRSSGSLIYWRDGLTTGEQNCGAFPNNSWTHVALTWNGSNEFICYINGVPTKKTAISTRATTLNAPAAIGQYTADLGGAGTYWPGQIDEVKIWSSVRTESNIATDMSTRNALDSSNLLAYYDFNEGAGSTVYNRVYSATSASDFTYTGSPTLDASKIESTTAYGPYTVKKFLRTYITASGGWKVPAGVTTASSVVIAGGGGGGSRVGGGGGAGGYIYTPKISLTPGAIETIQIGQGGLGAQRPNIDEWQGHDGQNTVFSSRATAIGGGGGGGYNTASNTFHEGRTGGSGGGAAPRYNVLGTWSDGIGLGTDGQGRNGGYGYTDAPYPAGGGGGAGGPGGTATTATAIANGGAGILDPLSGSLLCLAAGGGGGVGSTSTGTTGGVGGACTGGTTTGGTGTEGQVVPAPADANSGSGGGGAGYISNNANDVAGGNGGSGIIMIRWITASKPTYTAPTNVFLNVGQTETFTTNVAADSATAMLTRTFRWESTTGGSGGTYSLLKSGTGAANASYSWVPSDTSTSGSQYLYRVIVTDSDTAGLFIQDTSTAVFATINRTLAFTGSTTITKTVGRSKSETFTATFGTPTYKYTLSPALSSLSIDSSTAGFAVLKISDTLTVGTYTTTITVTDSVSASVSIPLTIKVVTPPSFSAGELVDSGTVLFLDIGNSNTYPGSGTSLGDLSGQGLSTSLVANMTGKLELATSTTCSAPTYSTDHFGILNFASPRCGYISNIGLLRSYTVETWVKRSGDQGSEKAIIATPWAGTGKQINISIYWSGSNSVRAGIYSGGAWYSTTAATIADNTWVRLSATFNETTNVLSLFVDSETVSTRTVDVTVTWDLAKLDTGLVLGRKWGDEQYFNGSMGYLRIYNRALSGAELLQNYNATKARFLTGQLATTHSSKYGTAVTDTFTVTSGAPNYTFNYADLAVNRDNSVPGFTYNTSNQSAPTLTVIKQLQPGTYYDTFTVTDSNGASTRLLIKALIAKADTITIGFDTPTVVTFTGGQPTLYPKPVFRGLVNNDNLTVQTRFTSSRYPISGTVPVNADTYTVSATLPFFTTGLPTFYEAVVYETSTLTILQARQNPLNVSMYGAVVGAPFTITLLGGSDTGTVTESITAGSSAAGCSITNHVLTMTSTTPSYCNLLVTKASTQNYLAETQTVSIYFMIYVINQPAPPAGSGSTIALGGSTSVTVINTAPPAITSLSATTAATGTSIDINGSGFSAANLEVKFWRNKIPSTYSVVSDSKITATIPAGTTSGRIIITTANGSVASDFSLVITP